MNYSWWNELPLHMDGTLLTIGNFPIRYYGLMYLAAFFTCYQAMAIIIKREKLPINAVQLEGLATWIIGGILIGARLGYVFFYNFSYYIKHPFEMIIPFSFEGGFHFTGIAGMSYHGGLIGAVLAGSYFIRKHKLDYWMVVNLSFTAAPLGYTWGRIGNFLNGELYGRVTNSPIGMLFPMDTTGPGNTPQLRHPSQLYEAFSEGVLLFAIIWFLRSKGQFKHHIMSLYLIGYGTARYIVEFFREPDAHIGLNMLGQSRGQMLCLIMILAGIGLWVYRQKRITTHS
jgi:phosphatidylglycerol---prolipoprotein diacylglyceryl transferase